MKIIIVPAQGFGDWILINLIIRILSKKYYEIGLVYNSYSIEFIRYMFSDLLNVKPEIDCQLDIPNISTIKYYCEQHNCDYINYLLINAIKC